MIPKVKIMKKYFFLFLVFISISAYSQEGYVDYLDGYLDIKSGNDWLELDMGDIVDSDSVIKLWDDSYVEITVGTRTIKISQAGIYNVVDLMKSADKIKGTGVVEKAGMLISRFLYGDNRQKESTVGGVRAFSVDDALRNMPDVGSDILVNAFEAFTKGENVKAKDLFLEGLSYADDNSQELMAIYFLAQISYEENNLQEALEYLDEAWLDEYADYNELIIFLKGQILIETNGNQQAIDWFNENPLDDDARILQAVRFLEAIANYNLGNMEISRKLFSESINIDPNSDIASAARIYQEN